MSFPFLQPYAGLGNSLQTAQAAVGGAGGIGGWVELGRTTLGSAGDDITVSSLPDKRYYMILSNSIPTGNVDCAWRTGNGSVDTGNNYASRASQDGGAETTATTTDRIRAGLSGTISAPQFHMGFWSNLSSKEKLFIGHSMGQNTAGAGTAPTRRENVGKWTSVSNSLDTLTATNAGAGSHNTGSELVVLGWDPADTHTSNFWEELADASWSSGQTMDSGSFTSKKYLWIQYYVKSSGLCRDTIRFNSDTGNNYSKRKSDDGGSDSTTTSNPEIRSQGLRYNISYGSFFVVNNSSNEKLVTGHFVGQDSSGAGAANAPSRTEAVGKWANTSSQISSVQIYDLTTNFTGGQIKVWGAD